ncbi:MAG: EI24 domain-containing protein [Alphaproteobacteria bacterium]
MGHYELLGRDCGGNGTAARSITVRDVSTRRVAPRYEVTMIAAFLKALAQLPEPGVRGTIVLSILGSVVISLALAGGVAWVLLGTNFVTIAWMEPALDLLGGLVVVGLIIVLFPAVVGLVAGLLLERVCMAVEAVHYPHLPPPRAQSILEVIVIALRFMAVLVVLNILALPLYLIPVVNVVLFYGLNGYLLGREFFEMVALRRMTPDQMRVARRRYRVRLLIVGAAFAFVTTVPLLNLVLPILAAATMLHVYEALPHRANQI